MYSIVHIIQILNYMYTKFELAIKTLHCPYRRYKVAASLQGCGNEQTADCSLKIQI